MKKRNILIIGASGDIGLSIANKLLEQGYQLILHYYSNSAVIEELFKHEQVLASIQANLSKEEEIKLFLKQLAFPVDGVVFASGKAQFGLFQDASEEILDEMLTLHVKAPWMITQHVLPSMIQEQYGKIIFISSIWGTVGASYEVIYSTVKGAQNSFVKALAKEVAPSSISVNAISPGFIDTKMNNHLTEDEKEAILADIPMQRAGKAEEIANTVNFLLGDQANYIQGEIIHITGGW
ncbi:SDR family oxidoreductase [Ornithinibacillus sp. 4-3]|uniref:SDR family oxidoreductase n=1 Tax=Ornithinibacillus sp. 4-3 TaxID=3231488 RepID=A0AB39HSS6_9BACI